MRFQLPESTELLPSDCSAGRPRNIKNTLSTNEPMENSDGTRPDGNTEPSTQIQLYRANLIDTHIHLWPQTEIKELRWMAPGMILSFQHSVEEYAKDVIDAADIAHMRNEKASSGYRNLENNSATLRPCLYGYIFVETDRKSDLPPQNWVMPLNEIAFLDRVARGDDSREDEGISPVHANLCKGIVPWAPVAAGREALREYRDKAMVSAGASRDLIKGWRYLLQDKDPEVMLQDAFIDGLKYLGECGECFDLGVDYRQGGKIQLENAVACLSRVYEGVSDKEQVVVIINHMCKPDIHKDELDDDWKEAVRRLAAFPKTYMKISGAFSEIVPLPDAIPDEQDFSDLEKYRVKNKQPKKKKPKGKNKSKDNKGVLDSAKLKHHKRADDRWKGEFDKRKQLIYKYIDFCWDAFGAKRCMYGSDWPVCKLNVNHTGPGKRVAWSSWLEVVEDWSNRRELRDEERDWFFHETALTAYRVPRVDWEVTRMNQSHTQTSVLTSLPDERNDGQFVEHSKII